MAALHGTRMCRGGAGQGQEGAAGLVVRVQGWRDSRRGGCSNSCWRRFCSGGKAQEEERRWLLQGRAQGGARQGRDAGERCRACRGRGRRT
jgi:hypothetical protein